MPSRRALITGVTGQDGSYLAELLLKKGYAVHGLVRRVSVPNRSNLRSVVEDITIHHGDVLDQGSLDAAVKSAEPDEVYHLAAQSFVPASFTQPELTAEVTALGTLRLLNSVKRYAEGARVFNAASSEMYGRVATAVQDETTPFHPRSPYGVAKTYSFWTAVNFREAYSMFVSNGILFNHESPRRGPEFVSRRISLGVARISGGDTRPLELGNLEAVRDWGYAAEYAELMWMILQHREPDDFVGATGTGRSVREFLSTAFQAAGIRQWQQFVTVSPGNLRPAEVDRLTGSSAKAQRVLGWVPKVGFEELVRMMVESDLNSYRANVPVGRG